MGGLPVKLRMHAEHAQVLADNALCSFIVINAALQRSSALAEYTGRGDVQKRMGEGYRVGMGFGLHTGCARALHVLLAATGRARGANARVGCDRGSPHG